MKLISSRENELIKHIKKLKDKKYRDKNNEYIVEGIKLVEEAIKEKVNIKKIIKREGFNYLENIPKEIIDKIEEQENIYVTAKIFEELTDVKTPQGILAIIEKDRFVEDKIDYNQDIIVALDNVQDPGNLGTILRTVDSIGINQILLSKGTVDSYNSKIIRSTMGATFRVKIIECEDLEKTLKQIKQHSFDIVVTSLQTSNSIYDINYKKKVIVIGNEANGVEQSIQNLADYKVKIPMLGKTESLNASVATGVILYEYVRQKIYQEGR